MVVTYDSDTNDLLLAQLDGGAQTTQEQIIDAIVRQVEADFAATFGLADDQTVAVNSRDYLAVVTTTDKITFENPPYTPGDVNGQVNWAQTALHVAGSLDVNATSPIGDSQDLKYNSATSGITHYRSTVTGSAGGGYVAKWKFRNSVNLGAASEVKVSMANSADTDGARAWICVVKGNGDVVFTDNAGNTTFAGVAPAGTINRYRVGVTSTGALKFYINGELKFTGNIIAGNQTVDRWIVAAGPNTTINADTGRFDDFLYSVPTGVIRRKSILVTPVSSSIEMSGECVLNIQLRNAALGNDPVSTTVTLTSNQGLIVPGSVVTNGSGFSNEAVFKPGKFARKAGIFASATGYVQLGSEGSVFIEVDSPSTDEDQQFIETADIKDDSITPSKQAAKSNVRTPGLHNFWFIAKAFIAQILDVNNDGNTDRNINSIVVDDLGFFYVNCFEGPVATNPVVKRFDKNTGVIDWSVALTHNNLTSGFDGMCFDGKYIWVACANYIRRVNVLNSADTTEYLLATDLEGGNVQAMAFDGEFIWLHLRGGTNANADKIWKVNPSTGAAVSYVDYRTSDPIGTGVRDIKQFAMDDEFLYFASSVSGVSASDWVRVKRSDGTLTYRNEGDQYGAFGAAIDILTHHLYVGGGEPSGAAQLNLDTTDSTPRNVALNWSLAQWYDLLFDGKYLWGVSTLNSGSATKRVIRKIKHNVGAGTLDSVQAIDFDGIAVGLAPTALAFDGQYLYVANFAATTNSVVKIFVGS